MGVVPAFTSINGTTHAGLTAYFRAEGCTALTIADVLPCLSKINFYTPEYVIGEMKIWDTGSESAEPNNCSMVRIIVYADGWICAWFDKETQNQGTTSSCPYVGSTTLGGFGSFCEYPDKWNGCMLKVVNSNGTNPDDPECPDGTIFCIRNTDFANGRILVHKDYSPTNYHFNSGNTYDVELYMSNGNLIFWGHASSTTGSPSSMSNRLYRAIYEMWSLLRYSSNATNATNAGASKALLDDGGSFTDYTTAFNNSTANDVHLMPVVEEVDDAFYYGYSYKSRGLNLNIGTAGIGNTIVWEYWNGSAWSSLSVTDATSGFTVAGTNTVTFIPPPGWEKCLVNGLEYFWIRSRVSVASFTTQPLLTQGWFIVPDHITYLDTNFGLYSFEDTGANYCLISGRTDTTSPYRTYVSKFFYNTVLPTKLIYSYNANYGYYITTTIGRAWHYINDHTISSDITPGSLSNGYRILNIEDIDVAVGAQNVFKDTVWGYTTQGRVCFATVLITS